MASTLPEAEATEPEMYIEQMRKDDELEIDRSPRTLICHEISINIKYASDSYRLYCTSNDVISFVNM